MLLNDQFFTVHNLNKKTLHPDIINMFDKNVPHIIKYMGAKKNILSFVVEGIKDTYNGGRICDLFAGTGTVSGALRNLLPIHSNDIQEYSAVLSNMYLSNYNWSDYSSDIVKEVIEKASDYVEKIKKRYPGFIFSYDSSKSITEFIDLEKQQQNLINFDFKDVSHHLFIKYYSGTYWSYQQCLWIDALRKVADDYKNTPIFYVILSSLMYAMSYNSQSTGHYAQFRDATSLSSKKDILIYRQKEILPYFVNKFVQLRNCLGENKLNHFVSTLDYSECLDEIEMNSLVYADPPYAFVHYSRFYHVLETLVKYDYPKVTHKGRYRDDRHQSPFCKKSSVKEAFSIIFSKIDRKQANLILSYSNTGMITLNEIINIAKENLGYNYDISVKEVDYKHSTMGRKNDKNRNVKEYLLFAKRK